MTLCFTAQQNLLTITTLCHILLGVFQWFSGLHLNGCKWIFNDSSKGNTSRPSHFTAKICQKVYKWPLLSNFRFPFKKNYKKLSDINEDRRTDEDIRTASAKPGGFPYYYTLRPIWGTSALSLRSQMRIFNTSFKSIPFYGSKTWRKPIPTLASYRCTTNVSVTSFINLCFRKVMPVHWQNEEREKRSYEKEQDKNSSSKDPPAQVELDRPNPGEACK